MRRKLINSTSAGFTILELMIAMAVFSIILLAAAAGLIQIGRMYYQTVITARTQDTNRAIIDEISSAIQFSGSTPHIRDDSEEYSGVEVHAICIGNTRYSYALNRQLTTEVAHVLWRDRDANNDCTPVDITQDNPSVDGIELIGEHMRLTRFDVRNERAKDYAIAVSTVYGDTDLLVGVDDDGDFYYPGTDPGNLDNDDIVRIHCNPDGLGTQFCAVAELSTLVARRL